MVNLGELCDLLGVTSTTLYRMLEKGTCPIPHTRFGKIFMFPVEDVEAFLRAETQTGKSPEENR
jgi:excisionase family DNA binding protein